LADQDASAQQKIEVDAKFLFDGVPVCRGDDRSRAKGVEQAHLVERTEYVSQQPQVGRGGHLRGLDDLP
jgi:hypothetical protein